MLSTDRTPHPVDASEEILPKLDGPKEEQQEGGCRSRSCGRIRCRDCGQRGNQGLMKPGLTPWSKTRCSLTTTSADGGRRPVPKRRRSCSSSPPGSTVDSGYQHPPSSEGCSSTIRQAKIKTNLDHGAKKVAECLVSRDENATTEQNAKMTKAQTSNVMIDGELVPCLLLMICRNQKPCKHHGYLLAREHALMGRNISGGMAHHL